MVTTTLGQRLAVCACVVLLCACGKSNLRNDDHNTPAEINAELGLNYLRQGNVDIAIEKLKRAQEQDPKLAATYHYYGLLYQRLSSWDLADQNFKHALELAPHDAAIQNNYGAFLCDRGRYREAEKLFLEAARSPEYKRSYEAYENAGLCVERIPDRKKAEQYFRRALEINPVLPTSLFNMAQMSFDEGEYLKARAFLQRYHAVVSPSPQTLFLAVRVERALDDTAAAERFSRQLSSDFPKSEEAKKLDQLPSK